MCTGRFDFIMFDSPNLGKVRGKGNVDRRRDGLMISEVLGALPELQLNSQWRSLNHSRDQCSSTILSLRFAEWQRPWFLHNAWFSSFAPVTILARTLGNTTEKVLAAPASRILKSLMVWGWDRRAPPGPDRQHEGTTLACEHHCHHCH